MLLPVPFFGISAARETGLPFPVVALDAVAFGFAVAGLATSCAFAAAVFGVAGFAADFADAAALAVGFLAVAGFFAAFAVTVTAGVSVATGFGAGFEARFVAGFAPVVGAALADRLGVRRGFSFAWGIAFATATGGAIGRDPDEVSKTASRETCGKNGFTAAAIS